MIQAMLVPTAISGTRARLLASVLVVALLVCHGFFGAFHELSGPASPGGDVAASAAHAGGETAGHGGEDGGAGLPGHLGAADYYAAVLVLLLAGAALFSPRVARPVRLATAARAAHAGRPPRSSPVFAQGMDPPFSQVFRL